MLSELIDFLGSLHPLIVHLPIGIVCLTIAIDVFMKNKNNKESIRASIILNTDLT